MSEAKGARVHVCTVFCFDDRGRYPSDYDVTYIKGKPEQSLECQ